VNIYGGVGARPPTGYFSGNTRVGEATTLPTFYPYNSCATAHD